MAKELSKRGYDLILVARDSEKLNKVKSELQTNIEVVCMDLSNVENCQKLHEEHKEIDILINNAGFGDCGYFTKTNLDKEIKCQAKIRSTQQPTNVTARPLENGEVEVIFEDMQKSIAPGQSVVLYDGDVVLGGGIIKAGE